MPSAWQPGCAVLLPFRGGAARPCPAAAASHCSMLLPRLHPNRAGQQDRWQLHCLGRSTAPSCQQMALPAARKLRPPCQATCCTADGTAGLNALAILPDFRSGDIRRSKSQYSQADRWEEGFGSVLGRAALLKSADLRFDPAAVDSVLNEVVAYQRLQRLHRLDVAVLEAAGMLDNEVVLAVSGGERPERPSTGARLLRRPRDPRDVPPPAKWAALDALRRIHDAGVLHCSATSRSLLLRRRQVSCVGEPSGPLLWADFGDSRIVPGLNRDSAAALGEAFTAAVSLNEPAWLFHNLLQPVASPSAAMASVACDGVPPQELPMAALLPAYDGSSIIMGSPAGASTVGRLHRGSVLGRPAIINAAALASSPLTALTMAAEAYMQLQHLQGTCVPELLAAGTLREGCVAFVATSPAGTSADDLEQCQPLLDSFMTPQVRTAALEALSRVHDAGVLHGGPLTNCLMIQHKEDGAAEDAVQWANFALSHIVPGLGHRSAAAEEELNDAKAAIDGLQLSLTSRRQLAGTQHSTTDMEKPVHAA